MTTPINLNRVRKTRAKAAKTAEADANAARHGRTKAQREIEAAQKERTARHLDNHRRDDA